ncbi:hypothetical protein [Heyndrickxia acidiproducens]|jgi:hypothetical protein|uniref:hypothetical protein n=1 Tax=Heyndrickxia acidiproducens TaxID=1121084 RepID=UPI00036A1312|nr:hypothetical protein [Heyndrickxia acidiproducens]
MDKEPKFQIGDTVVVKVYGTVGKITKIKRMNGQYFYVVNDREGLFKEESLVLLTEYDGILYKKEEINIEFKYFIGDIVKVKGYSDEIFKVVGFRTEIWRYAEDAWEDIIYEMVRIPDGEWLEADEQELILIADFEQADTFLNKYEFFYPVKKNHLRNLAEDQAPTPEKIDQLLDLYNDYRILFQLFGDDEYKMLMDSITSQLHFLMDHGRNQE